MRRTLWVLLLAGVLLAQAGADNVRGPVSAVLDARTRTDPVQIEPGDLIIVRSTDDTPLHTALKIEIAIPDAVAGMRGVFALYLYENIVPTPHVDIDRYRADKIEVLLLPPSKGFTIQLPYSADYTGPESFDTLVLERAVHHRDYPLLLTILPVMKGIPPRVASSIFRISAEAVSSATGLLRIIPVFPGDERLPYTVNIDGVPIRTPGPEYALGEGMHTLRLTSEHYTNQNRTFTIRGGEYTEVKISLEPRSSRIFIEAPETSRVLLDGTLTEISNPAGLEIPPGEHTVLIKIGDYSLTERFSVKPGMTYTVSLQMNIHVESH
jgi:hypothetical protein